MGFIHNHTIGRVGGLKGHTFIRFSPSHSPLSISLFSSLFFSQQKKKQKMASITVIGASSTCKLPSLELYKKYKLTSISTVKLHSFDGNKSRHVTNNLLHRHNRLANFSSSDRFLPSAVATPNSSSSSLLSDEAFQGLGSGFDGEDDDFPSRTASLNADELDISKLDLPSQLVDSLRERGITQLFPIQVRH